MATGIVSVLRVLHGDADFPENAAREAVKSFRTPCANGQLAMRSGMRFQVFETAGDVGGIGVGGDVGDLPVRRGPEHAVDGVAVGVEAHRLRALS